MGSSREPPSANGPAASGSAHDAAPADADATVISGRASGGSLSTTDIGRLLEGSRLGAYQLEQFIGGGGMGAVFRALDTTLDRVVAVKVLSRQQSADEEMLRRFRNEAQSAARLDHENISRVHAVGSDDGWHFIVFEFIDGTNLRDIVREAGPFSASRVINVSIQVADALEHASDRDVVHRDIKPSNIIITPGGRARLVDMGLARLLHVDTREDLTASGMTLGTFDYISPEQARDPRSADVRSDLYSLGCTMFFMLVGRPPFAEGTMVQKLLQHQQSPPPAIDDLRPDVPRRLAGVVARLMAKDPADRYQQPADLIADLLGIAEEEDIDISSSRSPTVAAVVPAGPPAGDRGSPLPWLVPVAGLVGLVAWLWWTSAGMRGTAPRPAPAPDVRPATTAGVAPPTTPWRVVDTPRDERDLATLAEAMRRAGNGDVIELAYDGVRDEQPFGAAAAALTVRAAPDRSPTIRFPMPLAGESSREQPPAAWPVASGVLTLERVRIVLVPGGPAGTSLFALGDDATLVCEDCRLEVEEDDAPFDTSAAAAATLVRLESTATGTATRGEVRMTRTVAIGAGQFLRVGGDRSTDVTWFGGRCILGDAFLVAEGGEDADGPATSLSLEEGAFACRGGFARLLDSPARPALPSLRVIADACRFAVPDGHALLEQTGVDEPDHYRAVVEWLDAGGRYEGSGVFRRIDGAGERVEIDYASAGQPLVHSATIDPDIADWWSGDPDS